MFKRKFESWVHMRWVKRIDNAYNTYAKLKEMAQIQHFILMSLLEEYAERYPEKWAEARRRAGNDE